MKNVLLTILALSALSVHAQQTQIRLNVQGILRTASGIAVPDGPQNVTFKLYTAASGGTAQWEETAQVTVTAGIYNYNLGSQTAIDPGIFANGLFLGVTVDGTELLPRAELTFSPYSIRAFTVACSGAVGDVKYSILNPDEFRLENGDCWVPMDGRALSSSDKLRIRTGMTNVPNAGGLFVRSQEFSNTDNDPDRTHNSSIAAIQGDAFKTHNHGVSDPGHSHGINDPGHRHGITSSGSDDNGNYNDWGNSADRTNHTDNSTTGITIVSNITNISIQNSGSSNETRPKNINLWTYIRIN